MVVPNFAKNLISVGRLTENGNTFETNKHGAKLTNASGESLNFYKGPDGTGYLFSTKEDALLKHVSDTGDRIGANPSPTSRLWCVVSNTINSERDDIGASLQGISVTFDNEALSWALKLAVAIQVVKISGSGRQFEAEHIARNWGIDIHAARRTFKATTQRGIQTLLHPSLTRRCRTNDCQLRYR